MSDDIRGMFDSTPPAPETDGWAQDARRRARRTSTAWRMTFVTVAIVVGIAVPLMVTPLWGRPGVAASPTVDHRPTTVPTDPPPTSRECEAQQPGGAVDGRIPMGATGVTLCGAYTNGNASRTPVGSLTTGVDDLAKWINSQSEHDKQSPCTDELGPAYNLVFSYPDGSRTVVTYELYGCRVIRTNTNGGARSGADDLDATLRKMWADARRNLNPAMERPGSWCPNDTYWSMSYLSPDSGQVRDARTCIASGYPQNYKETKVSGADFNVLKADLQTGRTKRDDLATRDYQRILVLSGPYGDLLYVGKSDTADTYTISGSDMGLTWNPGPEARKVLKKLLG